MSQEKNMNQTHDNISELGPDTEIRQITKFVDDVDIETYEKPMMSSTLAWTKMAEDSKLHDIHAILQRPVVVASGEFNNAFSSLNLKFPDIIFQRSNNVVRKLDYFTYFRANVKIKLVFNATPFMSGKYWMFFAPFDEISNRGARIGTLPNNTGFPGVELDLASNAPVEIKIPYCAPLSHYNLLDTHSNMGELYVVPINAIQTGVSPVANGATFTVFAWFEDIELAMPTSRPLTVPVDREWTAQVGRSEEQAVTSGPPISGAANAVASVASVVGGAIPTLGKWLRPVEWVSRAIGGAAEAVGWNKPTNLDKNCVFSNVPAKGYTNADGIDMSSKLCAMPDNGLTYDGGIFSTDVDEMDIKYVTSKSCIFRSSIPWSITSAVGQDLHYNSVAPGTVSSLGLGPLDPTTLGFVASMFRYWRGTIKYRLTVAKTAFHTGRLRITYHPGVYGETPITPGGVNENAYNWILDLSVSSELEFEIPYIANVPWKECYVGRYDDTNAWRQERYSTGTITITVLTQLRRASDSVANNCPINMWVSGGDDISFAIPDFGSYGIAAPTYRVKSELEHDSDEEWTAQVFNLTSKSVEHNEQVTNMASEMFPMQHMSPTSAEELTMGEKITNLRQLIKRFGITSRGVNFPYKQPITSRYCFPGPIPLNNDDYLYNQITLDPSYFGKADGRAYVTTQREQYPISRNNDGTLDTEDFDVANHYPTRCPLYYISYLFRFYRGGRRYKIANPATGTITCTNAAWRESGTGQSDIPAYTNLLDQYEVASARTMQPMIAVRDSLVKENGTVEGPIVNTFTGTETAPLFEHYIYPDLNGTLEFEVPYYAQTPISLVGEGTIADDQGPLIRRALVRVRRSEDPKGLDQPVYSGNNQFGFMKSPSDLDKNFGGIRGCFGGYTLYEAAADDFSFGYLIGAPRIQRIGD